MPFSDKHPELAFWDLARLPQPPSADIVQGITVGGTAAIERILRAVGREYVPPTFDREALRIEIGQAYLDCRVGLDLFEDSKAKDRAKRLRRMHKTADKLAKLLKTDPMMGSWIQGTLDRAYSSGTSPLPLSTPFSPIPLSAPQAPPKPPKIFVVLEELQLAIAIVEQHQKLIAEKWRGRKRDSRLNGRRPTGPDWLAGIELPLVFERHFLRRAGRSRGKSGAPQGPMIRFISAAMQELGLPYSDESIATAYRVRAPLRKERRRGDTLLSILRQ